GRHPNSDHVVGDESPNPHEDRTVHSGWRNNPNILLPLIPVGIVLAVVGVLIPSTIAFLLGWAALGASVIILALKRFLFSPNSSHQMMGKVFAIIIALAITPAPLYLPGAVARQFADEPTGSAEHAFDPSSAWTTGTGAETLVHGVSGDQFIT